MEETPTTTRIPDPIRFKEWGTISAEGAEVLHPEPKYFDKVLAAIAEANAFCIHERHVNRRIVTYTATEIRMEAQLEGGN